MLFTNKKIDPNSVRFIDVEFSKHTITMYELTDNHEADYYEWDLKTPLSRIINGNFEGVATQKIYNSFGIYNSEWFLDNN